MKILIEVQLKIFKNLRGIYTKRRYDLIKSCLCERDSHSKICSKLLLIFPLTRNGQAV
jgi:hypothetical protein